MSYYPFDFLGSLIIDPNEEKLEQLNEENAQELKKIVIHNYLRLLHKQKRESKKPVNIEVSMDSPEELKDFILSRKQMIRKGEWEGKNYTFTYTEDFEKFYKSEKYRHKQEREHDKYIRRKRKQLEESTIHPDSE